MRHIAGTRYSEIVENAMCAVLGFMGIRAEPPNCDSSSWTFGRVSMPTDSSRRKFRDLLMDLTEFLDEEDAKESESDHGA